MKMPGFTAEASQYKMNEHYQHALGRAISSQAVIPQVISCHWYCYGIFGCCLCCFDVSNGEREWLGCECYNIGPSAP